MNCLVAPTEIAEAVVAALINAMGLAALALGRSGAWASTPGLFVEQILAELRAWAGPLAELQDDVTLVVVDVA